MLSNLGIYDSETYNENPFYPLNENNKQGIQFKNYGKKYYKDNQHKLLEESSSSTWESIVEAFNEDNSVNSQKAVPAALVASSDKIQFNNLLSKYSTTYNTYTSAVLSNKLSDASRDEMEKELMNQQAVIIQVSRQIQNNNKALMSTHKNLNAQITNNKSIINDKLEDLSEQRMVQENINNYDKTTLNGLIESTELNMTSMYYHYLVYFLISITLIAFTFNIFVNPDANALNALIVVCAIMMVYFITRNSGL
jgi:hypothetical protein